MSYTAKFPRNIWAHLRVIECVYPTTSTFVCLSSAVYLRLQRMIPITSFKIEEETPHGLLSTDDRANDYDCAICRTSGPRRGFTGNAGLNPRCHGNVDRRSRKSRVRLMAERAFSSPRAERQAPSNVPRHFLVCRGNSQCAAASSYVPRHHSRPSSEQRSYFRLPCGIGATFIPLSGRGANS